MDRRLNLPKYLEGLYVIPENYRDDDWREFADWSYGHWREVSPEDATHFLPHYLSGSDYSGSSVERSNYKVFLEEYGDVPGVLDVSGGHDTYAVAIPLTLPDDVAGSIEEVLEGLADYPVDDEALAECETEAADEAWDCWAESDYKQALCGRFPALEEILDETPSGTLRQLFEDVRESLNLYWECETGGEMYVDVGEVADATELRDLVIALGVEYETIATHEHVPLEGNVMASGDPEVDNAAESWVRHELEQGNLWAWCTVSVTARLGEFEGTDYLGACSYESQEAFEQPGGYYDDMKNVALDRLLDVIDERNAEEGADHVVFSIDKLGGVSFRFAGRSGREPLHGNDSAVVVSRLFARLQGLYSSLRTFEVLDESPAYSVRMFGQT